jgi:hypothetical protein
MDIFLPKSKSVIFEINNIQREATIICKMIIALNEIPKTRKENAKNKGYTGGLKNATIGAFSQPA